MKNPCFLFGAAVLFSMMPCGAQNPTTPPATGQSTEEEAPKRFWQATLPGGHYMVSLDRITSISRQTYLLDGAVVVHEVSVDTIGQALARFYFLEPVKTPSTAANQIIDRGRELLDQAGERSGTDLQKMVVKKYPETTHAKCLEYRLEDAAELDSLYKSLRDSWESGRGRKFAVK
jgi:hypothetical protein